jgi:hypothetical protein
MLKLRFAMKVIENSVDCKKNSGCLKEPENFCCKVLSCIDKKIHFIDYSSSIYCSYKITFGNSDICSCPARKALFNNKGI